MVPGLRQLTYEQRLQRLGLWTLEERRNRADLLEVSRCIKDYHWLHSVDSLQSVMFRQHVAIQPKLSRVTVILTDVDSSSHSELLKGGMVYRKASSAATRSTRSRMVAMQRGRSRWATSWTNQSAWPSGHTCSVDSSPEQVRPHLVSYLVNKCSAINK